MTAAAVLDDRALLDACDDGAAAERIARAIDPAARSLAAQDAALLALHLERYGGWLVGVAQCPSCAESVEAALAVAAVLAAEGAHEPLTVRAAGVEVEFRMPAPGDVRAARDERDLAERCVVAARRLGDGAPVAPADVGDAAIAAMAQRMEAVHPAGDLGLTLICPACEHRWDERVDVAEFVAARARADAERIVDEIHALATAYGWTEAEILALPRRRRRRYLDRLVG